MKISTHIISFLILSFFLLPIMSSAQAFPNLIVCDGGTKNPCTFAKLLELFQKGITALLLVSTLVTVIALIVMGFSLMTAQGNESKLKEVKTRAGYIVWGYACIVLAWTVVYTILKVLVKPGSGYNLLENS